MEVLLLILKIIGILLLAIAGISLFLILSVIFIPVRYRVRGKGAYPGTIEGDAVFSWFLHLVYCRIQYGEKKAGFKLRIFGIPVSLGKEKRAKKRKRGKDVSKEQTVSKEQNISEEISSSEETKEVKEEVEVLEQQEDSKKTSVPKKKKRKSGTKRKGRLKRKIQDVKQKIAALKEQISNIKNILSEETNRNAIAVLFREFKYLLKHYTPRCASGEIGFGMDDPANTGQILGIVSLFPFWYRYRISVIPDFTAESLYVRGNFSIKGHMRSVHLLVTGIRLIKNKEIRKLINQIRT